ncbi:alkaline phosphatase [Pirellula sp. SH-Sr6A]|uniref:alkaline phosphatase n=1 Tax=Pirellula sp. SH-Sr6A TaxID=1632865 RepID=UPI001F0AD91C|nr:alkaline phosphatase [Pirellula sp. SH-Sr6A]
MASRIFLAKRIGNQGTSDDYTAFPPTPPYPQQVMKAHLRTLPLGTLALLAASSSVGPSHAWAQEKPQNPPKSVSPKEETTKTNETKASDKTKEEPEIVPPAGELDRIGQLQETAMLTKTATWGHWGNRPKSYTAWTSHSNRLIPVYVYGGSFDSYMNEGSLYRDEEKIKVLYGRLPPNTLNPEASYADQTDIYRLQRKSVEELGKKYVFLVVFDGMDWQSTQAAAIYKSGKIYTEGKGSGLLFQDYTGAPSSYGYVVTAPYADEVETDVDAQLNLKPLTKFGGYDSRLGGTAPWVPETDIDYPIGRSKITPHAYTDSSSSATSLTAGVKAVNGAVNLDGEMKEAETIARWAQRTKGFAVGAVSSVPICHATPAAAYAANVSRDDYQDLSRDLLGLPSVSRKEAPHPGLDVLIGCGYGETAANGAGQGANFVPGNRYLAESDRERVDIAHGGSYVVSQRTPGRKGAEVLFEGAAKAREGGHRFLGFFGAKNGHLPFRTANGDFITALDAKQTRELYKPEDIEENPSLAQMTEAAISVLEKDPEGFWLMVESGDVDWANHANNIDSSIGSVLQGEEAIGKIFQWIESKNLWKDSLVVITADHGHFFHLTDPSVLVEKP